MVDASDFVYGIYVHINPQYMAIKYMASAVKPVLGGQYLGQPPLHLQLPNLAYNKLSTQ